MRRIVPFSEIWGESYREQSFSGHTLQGGVEFFRDRLIGIRLEPLRRNSSQLTLGEGS